MMKKSFDVIGDSCIIEIPEELRGKESLIAEALLKKHKRLKRIYRKDGRRDGPFRLYGLTLIHGKHGETEHVEHGCRFRLDVRKAYFSPRESTERQRIARMAGKREKVLVMFAGVGPYAIVIGKKVSKVYAVEINSDAFEYMVTNIRLNRLQTKVVPMLGDVEKKCPDLFWKFDRVVMPLPMRAHEYLPVAIQCLKPKGGFVHMYHFSDEGEFKKAGDLVRKAGESLGKGVKIKKVRKVLPYSPGTWKVCVDAKVG